MRCVALLAIAALAIPLASTGTVEPSWALPAAAPAAPSVSVLFPIDTGENGSLLLAETVATALGLGVIVRSSTVTYDIQDPRGVWSDGLNDTVPLVGHGPPAAPRTVVEAETLLGPTIRLHYTADPGVGVGGSFVFAEIAPYPVDVSLPGAAQAALLGVSASLGIVADGSERSLEYVYDQDGIGDRLSSTLYRPYDGRSVEFANQFQLLAWTANGTVEVLRLFPWVEPLAPPAVSEAEGLGIARARVNETVDLTGYRYASAVAGYALDPRVYRFARSYRLAYVGEDAPSNDTTPLTSWVDAESGDVLLVDSSAVRPLGGTPPNPIFQIVTSYGGLAILAAAAIVAVSMSLRSDAARLAVLAAVTLPFFRLRRERALEHFVRGQIYEYLRSRPGSTYSDIRDDLSLNNGTAAHHLMVLEKMGLIVSKRGGRLKHFFRADTAERVVTQSISALQYDILDAVGDAGLTQAELATRLHVSRQRVSRNVQALKRRGFVVYEGKGFDLRLTDAGRSALRSSPLRTANVEEG